MNVVDYAVVVGYFVVVVLVGLYFRRRAQRSLKQYFTAGRQLSWWLAGLSMVATTFAADTPLAVTELVRQKGLSGNWLWWNMLIGGMLTTFFFAPLWHKAQVLTDVEFLRLRYAAKPAKILSVFKSIHYGFIMNLLILAWVNTAMMTLIQKLLNLNDETTLIVMLFLLVLTSLYTALSGIIGVVFTDAIQFFIAFFSCVLLAFFIVAAPEVGGLQGLQQKVNGAVWAFFPEIDATLIMFLGFQWWASWYPGAEPGGGGYIAQRMFTTQSPEQATKATLLFQILHYVVRPWPWILTAVATLIVYPHVVDHKQTYVMAMEDFLPWGFRGVLLAAFLAAYMSTISTHLNWGSSYFVHDFLALLFPALKEKAQIRWAQGFTFVLALLSLWVATFIDSIAQAWQWLLLAGTGSGTVLLLRWYWWRINAWSELSAIFTPLLWVGAIALFHPQWMKNIPLVFFSTLIITSIAWIITTFLTPPTPKEQLQRFVQRVQPWGWWKPFYNVPLHGKEILLKRLKAFVIAVISAYLLLFAIGKGFQGEMLLSILLAVPAAVGLIHLFTKRF